MRYVFVLRGRETAIENPTMTISGLSSLRYKYGGTVIFKRGLSPPSPTRLKLRGIIVRDSYICKSRLDVSVPLRLKYTDDMNLSRSNDELQVCSYFSFYILHMPRSLLWTREC